MRIGSVTLCVCLLSCVAPAESLPSRAAGRVREAPASDRQSDLPRPGRARGEAAVMLQAECERCHLAEAADWRASLHRMSELEPAYQRAFAIEPMPFCRGCHAPEADPRRETPRELAELGVGCVSCHVTDGGAVLGVPREDARPAPHVVARDPRFAESGACAGCHEFAFPAMLARGEGALMQATVTEHVQSNFAQVSCADCHMPWQSGRRRHDFQSSRSPEVLQGALRVTARRSATSVQLELASVNVGHAFPTGDLFRRIEVSAEAVGPEQSSLGLQTVWLKRHFAPGTGHGRVLTLDDRLFDEPRRIEFALGDVAKEREVVWRVAYQRVAQPNGFDESSAPIEGEIELASGRLLP